MSARRVDTGQCVNEDAKPQKEVDFEIYKLLYYSSQV